MAKTKKPSDIPTEWTPDVILGAVVPVPDNKPYGLTQEQLVPGLHYPKPQGGGSPVNGNFTITATGALSISGLPFTPSLVVFNYSDGTGAVGNGNMSLTTQYAQFTDAAGSGGSMTTSLAIWLQAGGVNYCRGAYTSMNTDGFTLNITTAVGTTYANYIAYP